MYGRTINLLRIIEGEAKFGNTWDKLLFEFEDGSSYKIIDYGQTCCENRYMKTDDDLDRFIGSVLTNIELLQGGWKKVEDGEELEFIFLRVETSVGDFRVTMYNEHNGYYGGFDPEAIKVS